MVEDLLFNRFMKARLSVRSCNCGGHYRLIGHFVRKSDGKRVQRYRCARCKKSISDATFHPCFRQNKRHLNGVIQKLLCSSVSQRRIALILRTSRLTVVRKFEFLAAQAQVQHNRYQKKWLENPLNKIYLDEMEDRIHTKCKPVSIALLVSDERKIIDFHLSKIRPKHLKLYRLSKEKYPEWNTDLNLNLKWLLTRTRHMLQRNVIIQSDQKTLYRREIKRLLPTAKHQRFKSRKAVVAGLGELKAGGRDPLFPLNHTAAMLRANINRLVRRTWCSSKKLESLHKHILIYTVFHNEFLT